MTRFIKYNKAAKKQIDLQGTERSMFLEHIKNFQKHRLVQVCKDDCEINNNTITDNSFFIYFDKVVKRSVGVAKNKIDILMEDKILNLIFSVD